MTRCCRVEVIHFLQYFALAALMRYRKVSEEQRYGVV